MERRGLGKVKYYFYFPKGVDAIHIANHVRESCKREYPKVIKEVRENFDSPNTEAAEQTFVWLGKFKKILNNMNKRHHFFFLHCLVEDRNEYMQWCYRSKIKPKLPQAKGERNCVAPIDKFKYDLKIE